MIISQKFEQLIEEAKDLLLDQISSIPEGGAVSEELAQDAYEDFALAAFKFGLLLGAGIEHGGDTHDSKELLQKLLSDVSKETVSLFDQAASASDLLSGLPN